MKNYLIILMFLTLTANAQKGISFSVLQDVKLGLGLDAEHGNDKPTADVIINMNWQCTQYEFYYFALQTQYEHANLSSGYFRRYSVHGIWNFNRLIIPNLTIGAGVGVGALHRQNLGGLLTYSGTVDISYKVFKNIDVIIKNEMVRRPDLETPKLGYNLSFGLTFKPVQL